MKTLKPLFVLRPPFISDGDQRGEGLCVMRYAYEITSFRRNRRCVGRLQDGLASGVSDGGMVVDCCVLSFFFCEITLAFQLNS